MAVSIPSLAITIFHNPSAPTGWTKLTSDDDCAIRVTSGSVSPGGTRNFTSVFSPIATTGRVWVTSFSVNPTVANAPTHQHIGGANWGSQGPVGPGSAPRYIISPSPGTVTLNTGGGGGHNHSVSVPATLASPGVTDSSTVNISIQYIDVLVAQRN